MREELRTVLRDLGLLLHLPSAMAAVSVPVAVLVGDLFAVPVLAAVALAATAAGQALFRLFRHADASTVPLSMATVALAWLIAAAVAAVVFFALAAAAGAQAGAAAVFRDGWSAASKGCRA